MNDELIDVNECAVIAKRSVEAFRKFAKRNKLKRAPNQGRKVLYYKRDLFKILGLDHTIAAKRVA